MGNNVIKTPNLHEGFKPPIQASLFPSADRYCWKDFKYDNVPFASASFDAGGDNQSSGYQLEFYRGRTFEKSLLPQEGRKVKRNENGLLIQHRQDIDPFAKNPDDYETFEELLHAVLEHAKDEQRKMPTTIDHLGRYARLMTRKDQPFPIDFFNLNYTQYRYHMKWYEQTFYDAETGDNYYGLKHRKDVVDTFRTAYDLPDSPWNRYKLPPVPGRKEVLVLEPDAVHQYFIFDGYDNDREINRYFQYIFYFGFITGVRSPSELWMMKLSFLYDLERPYIRVVEKKKHNSTRSLYLEPVVLTAKTRKSFKNFVDNIRPKFETSQSGDALFISPYTGRPYTWKTFGKMLRQMGKKVDPIFYPYCMRHWCAIARIIQKWEERHPDPTRWVKEFLGHDSTKTTEQRYLQHAEEYYKRYHYDWIKRVLKFPKKGKGENPLKSKQGPKTSVSNGNPPRSEYGPAEI